MPTTMVDRLQDACYWLMQQSTAHSFQHAYEPQPSNDGRRSFVKSLLLWCIKWTLIAMIWPLFVPMYFLWLRECHPPLIYHASKAYKVQSIARRCHLLQLPYQPYAPTLLFDMWPMRMLFGGWLMSGHLQTVLMELVRHNPSIKFAREMVSTEDGG